MTNVESQVKLVNVLVSDIRDRVAQLTPEQLSLPSACADWQMQDVLSHLIGGAERQVDSMRRGRAGDSGPPQGFVSQESSALSATNAQRDIQRREQLGDGLLLAFDNAYAQLFRQLEEFGPDEWNTPCWHLRRGAMPAEDYVDLRIQELAIHDWDMRKALEPAPQLHSECIDALLDMAPKWLGMCFRPGERLAEPLFYEFELAPPHARTYVIQVNGDSFDILSPDASTPERRMICGEAPAFLLFVYGRMTGLEAIDANEFAITGGPEPLDRFQEWFQGV